MFLQDTDTYLAERMFIHYACDTTIDLLDEPTPLPLLTFAIRMELNPSPYPLL
jgi:hypothetical protein